MAVETFACGVHNPCHLGYQYVITDTIAGNLGKNDTGTNYDPAKHLATSKVKNKGKEERGAFFFG